ncbi:helix-turn-helix domain-containing protein [Streptomyces sp. NPDC004227]
MGDDPLGAFFRTATLTVTVDNEEQPTGYINIIAAMAEFERSLIKDRTRAGLEAAKAQGRTGGRPSVVSEDVLTVARARKANGESVSAIAKALGVSRATLYRHLGESA